jgi:hypothetical protein
MMQVIRVYIILLTINKPGPGVTTQALNKKHMKKYNVYYTIDKAKRQHYFLIDATSETGARLEAQKRIKKLQDAGKPGPYTIIKVELSQGFYI